MQVEAKRAVPRAESARDLSNSSSSANSLSRTMSSGLIPNNLGMNNNSIGATKKIFVGGLHYETKDGTSCAEFIFAIDSSI